MYHVSNQDLQLIPDEDKMAKINDNLCFVVRKQCDFTAVRVNNNQTEIINMALTIYFVKIR